MAQFSGTIELGVTTGNDADLIRNTSQWNGGVLDGSTTGLDVVQIDRLAGLGNYGGNGGISIASASSTQFNVNFGNAGRTNNHIPRFGGTTGNNFTTTSDRLIVTNMSNTITYTLVPSGTQVNAVSATVYTFVVENTLTNGGVVFFSFDAPTVGTTYQASTLSTLTQEMINFRSIFNALGESNSGVLGSQFTWNGSSYDGVNRNFSLAGSGSNSVEFNDKFVICDQFMLAGGVNSEAAVGSYLATNSTVLIDGVIGGRNTMNNRTSSIFNNVSIYQTNTNYKVIGYWNTGAPQTQIWNNVNLRGDVSSEGQCGLSTFYANIADDSQFNNLSLWNGLDLLTGDAKVGQIQNSSRANYNSTLFGPTYVLFNNVANVNMLVRFSNQGSGTATGSTRNNHLGCLSNPDFRAWEQLVSDSGQFFLDFDTGCSIAIINPLMGRPQTSGTARFYQTSVFNSATDAGGRAQWFIGHNPIQGIGSDHRYTFQQGDLTVTTRAAQTGTGVSTRTGGLFLFPASGSSWPTSFSFTNDADNVATGTPGGSGHTTLQRFNDRVLDNIPSGFLWRVQDFLANVNSNVPSTAGPDIGGYDDRRAPVPTYSDRSYRHYAWQQQWPGADELIVVSPAEGAPDSATGTSLNTLPAVTNDTPVNTVYNLTEQDGTNAPGNYVVKVNATGTGKEIVPLTGNTVEAARTSGYTIYNTATGWDAATSRDISKTADAITTQSDYNSVSTVQADVNTTRGVNQGSAIWALQKLEGWNRVTSTNVGTTNTHIPLLASYSGSTIDFGTNSVTFDLGASEFASTATAITMPTSRIDSDDSVTSIEAANITIDGDIDLGNAANTKCSLLATNTFTLRDIAGVTAISGLSVRAPTINLFGAFTGAMSNFTIGTGTNLAIAVNNWSTEQTVTGLQTRTGTQGVTFNLINTSTDTVTLDTLFGADRNFSGSNEVTLTSDTAIDITVPSGSGDGATIFVSNDGATTSQVTYNAGNNVNFIEEAAYDFRVTFANITGNSWALYGGTATNLTQTPLFSSHNGDSITGVTSGTGDATYGSVPNLGAAGGVTFLYLVTGNGVNATRTVKLEVTNPQITTSLPRPADTVITAVSAPQNTGTTLGHTNTVHSVTVSDGTTIGTGTAQPAAGDAIIELESNVAAGRFSNEEQTENFWAEARNTIGWKNAIIQQRSTSLIAAASGAVDTYDLFLPDGFGGIVKRVFLTDLTGATSRMGIHVLTGTRYSTDVNPTFNLAIDSVTNLRNAIPVLEIDNGARQIIFQQSRNDPTAVTTGALDARGVTRGNLTNIGLNVPIVNEAGDSFETTPTLPTGGN